MGLVKTRRLAAMQKQQRAKAGGGSVANVEMLPVPMLPNSNWGLKLVRVGVCLLDFPHFSMRGEGRREKTSK